MRKASGRRGTDCVVGASLKPMERTGPPASYCAVLALSAFTATTPSQAQSTRTSEQGPVQGIPSPVQTDAAAPAADASATPDIIVTAQKRSESISKVPMSITALTGDALAEKGVRDVTDLAKVVPGLSYVDSGNSTPVFSLRGVGFFDTALGARPAVTTYIDEVPLPFAAMALGADLDLTRVEVLKGPQGTLFGQNSTGGAINFVSAAPTDTFHAGIAGTFGRFLDSDNQGYVSGPLTSTISFRAAGRYERAEGWQYSLSRDDRHGAKDFLQGRLSVDWRPTDEIKVALSYNGFQDHGDTQAQQRIAFLPQSASRVGLLVGTPNFTPPPPDDRAADWDQGSDFKRHNSFNQIAARVDARLTESINLVSLSSYAHYKEDQLTDLDGTPYPANSLLGQGYLSSFSQELRLNGTYGALTWILGGSYAHDRTHQDDIFSFPDSTSAFAAGATTPLGSVGELADQRIDTKAVFGNVTVQATSKLGAEAGIRYTKADLSYSGCTQDYNGTSNAGFTIVLNNLRKQAGLAPVALIPAGTCVTSDSTLTPGLVTGTLDEGNVSWRVGLNYRPDSRTMFYANISKGYKAGSIPVISSTSAVGIQPVKQESVLAYEIGFKSRLLGNLVDWTGAAFYYLYDNKQLLGRVVATPLVFGPQSALVNVPKSDVLGGETQVTLRPLRGLALTGGATYLKTRVKGDFINYTILAVQTNFNGESFPYTPSFQAVGDASYRFDLASGLKAEIGGGANYRSSTEAGFGGDPLLYIRAYTLIDLRAAVLAADEHWKVGLFVRNLTNVYYWTNVARTGDSVRRLTGQPQTYGLAYSLKF